MLPSCKVFIIRKHSRTTISYKELQSLAVDRLINEIKCNYNKASPRCHGPVPWSSAMVQCLLCGERGPGFNSSFFDLLFYSRVWEGKEKLRALKVFGVSAHLDRNETNLEKHTVANRISCKKSILNKNRLLYKLPSVVKYFLHQNTDDKRFMFIQ